MEGITHVPISSRELLWKNPSPTSSFVAQSVSLPNLHSFEWILVVGRLTTQSEFDIQEEFTNVFSLSSGTEFSLSKARFVGAQAVKDRATNVYREMIVETDSIKFGQGVRTVVATTIQTIVDSYVAVPIAIYGIR